MWNRSYSSALWIAGQLPICHLTLRQCVGEVAVTQDTVVLYLPSIWPTIYFCLTTFQISTGTAPSLCILPLNTHTYTVGVRRLIMDYCLWLFFSLFRLEMRHQTIHYSQELTNHWLSLPRLLTQALHCLLGERNRRTGRKCVRWGLDESR